MTTNTNPSLPTSPEEESATDYLLRKVSGKKETTSPTVDTVVDLEKANVTPSNKAPDGGMLVNIIIVMMMVGILTATAIPLYVTLAGK